MSRSPHGAGRRVLVVDDERWCRDGLAALLSASGYLVQTAASGDEALALVDDAPPAVAIVDVNLGARVSGWDVIRHLQRRLPGLPIVVLTADGSLEARRQARELRVDGFLEKPIDWPALRATVAALHGADAGARTETGVARHARA